MGSQLVVKRGRSRKRTAAAAARELASQCANPEAALALVFVSPTYDADAMASALEAAFAPTPVYGCTTAGEIGGDGFQRDSVVAISLASAGLRVGAGFARDISKSAFSSGRQATLDALAALAVSEAELSDHRNVAMSFIDGRSGQEELFIAGAAATAPTIRFVGGSASDHLDAVPAARIFYQGRAWADCGMILGFASEIPFTIIKTEYMVPTDDRVVVTATGPGSRVVRELNGRPARSVHAEIIAKYFDGEIDASVASRYPFAYYVGGQPYVRSVMDFAGDGLRFACAVDHGAVLRAMRPGDLLGTTARDLQAADDELGGMSALIAFNCLGRFLESEATGSVEAVAELLCRYPIVGFNTFGEQVNALHVNQTLTALAFGRGGDG